MRVRCPHWETCDADWPCRHRAEHDHDDYWCNDPCDYIDDEEEDVGCEPVDEEPTQ